MRSGFARASNAEAITEDANIGQVVVRKQEMEVVTIGAVGSTSRPQSGVTKKVEPVMRQSTKTNATPCRIESKTDKEKLLLRRGSALVSR